MQLLSRERGLFNVSNEHQCFAAHHEQIAKVQQDHQLTSEEEWLIQEKMKRINAQQEKPAVKSTIITPFRDVPYFYGCYECGKYHFCYLDHHTCDTVGYVGDEVGSDRPTCIYSCNALLNIDNQVIGNYKDTIQFKEDARHNDFDAHAKKHAGGPAINIVKTPEEQKNHKEAKKRLKQDLGRFFRTDQAMVDSVIATTTTTSTSVNAISITSVVDDDEDDEFAVLRPKKRRRIDTADEGDNEDVGEDEKDGLINEGDGNSLDDDDATKIVISKEEAESTIRNSMTSSVSKRNRKRMPPSIVVTLGDREGGENGELNGEGGGGDSKCSDQHGCEEEEIADAMGAVDDEGGLGFGDVDEIMWRLDYENRGSVVRMKNIHDNVAFWDNYYSFLLDEKVPTPLMDATTTTSSASVGMTMNGFGNSPPVLLPNRKPGGGTSLLPFRPPVVVPMDVRGHVYAKSERLHYDVTIISESDRALIDTRIRHIVNILLHVSWPHDEETGTRVDIAPLLYENLLKKTTRYYVRVVTNIALLVYYSPYTRRIALEKHQKHEKQCKASYSSKVSVTVTDISSIMEGEQKQQQQQDKKEVVPLIELVPLEKLCDSLMLDLFTQELKFEDSKNNHIHPWRADPWLSTLKQKRYFEKVIVESKVLSNPLLIHNTNNRGGAKKVKAKDKNAHMCENLFYHRDISSYSVTVCNALRAYDQYPMWLTSVLYQ